MEKSPSGQWQRFAKPRAILCPREFESRLLRLHPLLNILSENFYIINEVNKYDFLVLCYHNHMVETSQRLLPQEEQIDQDIERITEQLHNLAEKDRPLFELRHICSAREKLASSCFVKKAQEFIDAGDTILAGHMLSQATSVIETAADPYQKSSGLLEIGKAYAKLDAWISRERFCDANTSLIYIENPVQKTIFRVQIAKEQERFEIDPQPYLRMAMSSAQKVERTDELEKIAGVFASYGYPKQAIDIAGLIDDEFSLRSIAEKVSKAGYPDDAMQISLRIKDQSNLGYMGKILAEHGHVGVALQVCQRLTDSHHIANVVEKLVEKGHVQDALGLLPRVDRQSLDYDKIVSFIASQGDLEITFGVIPESVDLQTMKQLVSGAARAGDAEYALRVVEGLYEKTQDIEYTYDIMLNTILGQIKQIEDVQVKEQALARLVEVAKTRLGDESRIDFLTDIASQYVQLGDKTNVTPLLHTLTGMLDKLHEEGTAHDREITIAALYTHLGEDDEAKRLALRYLNSARHSTTMKPEDLAGGLIAVAEVLKKIGDIEQADSLIAEAAASIKDIKDSFQRELLIFDLLHAGYIEIVRKQILEGTVLPEYYAQSIVEGFILIQDRATALHLFRHMPEDQKMRLAVFMGTQGISEPLVELGNSTEDYSTFNQVIPELINSGFVGEAIQIAHRMESMKGEGLSSTAIQLINKGYIDQAMELASLCQKPSDLSEIAKSLIENGLCETAHNVMERIDDSEVAYEIKTRIIEHLIDNLVDQYAKGTQKYGIRKDVRQGDYDALYTTLRNKGGYPNEAVLEDLVLLGAVEATIDRFIRLFPETSQRGLRKKYRQNSGYFLSQCLEGIAHNSTLQFLRSADIDFDALAQDWKLAGPDQVLVLFRNVEAMQALELKHFGVSNFLHTEFGISNFGRYPLEILWDMYSQQASTEPYGIILAAKYDHNGAFMQIRSAWEEFYMQDRGKYLVRIVEAGNRFGVARRLVQLDKKYGASQKIGFMIAVAHGNETGMRFGSDFQDRFSINDVLSPVSDRIKADLYTPHLPFAFISCSTGVINGVAQAYSRKFESNAVGPDRPTNVKSIKAVMDENGIIQNFDVEYFDENSGKLYTMGKISPN